MFDRSISIEKPVGPSNVASFYFICSLNECERRNTRGDID